MEQHHRVEPDNPALRKRLREKAPEIVIEAASVVLALLLAFAANAWHQSREDARAAARAHRGIVAEMTGNRQQLTATLDSVGKAIGRLQAALGKLQSGKDLGKSPVAVISPMSPLLPSSAAWTTAQATGTVGDFDYGWTLRVAKVYELQGLFLEAQQRVIYPPAPVAVPGMEVAGSPARRMFYSLQLQQELIEMEILQNFGSVLRQSYADLLDGSASVGQQRAVTH